MEKRNINEFKVGLLELIIKHGVELSVFAGYKGSAKLSGYEQSGVLSLTDIYNNEVYEVIYEDDIKTSLMNARIDLENDISAERELNDMRSDSIVKNMREARKNVILFSPVQRVKIRSFIKTLGMSKKNNVIYNKTYNNNYFTKSDLVYLFSSGFGFGEIMNNTNREKLNEMLK